MQTMSESGSAERLIAVHATSLPLDLRATPRAPELAVTPGSDAAIFRTVAKSTFVFRGDFALKRRPRFVSASNSPRRRREERQNREQLGCHRE